MENKQKDYESWDTCEDHDKISNFRIYKFF